MTSASELFYNRRSRFGRSSPDLGLESSFDRNVHAHGNRRHGNGRPDRGDLDGCDTFRRSSHTRVSSHRTSLQERESIRLEEGSSQSASGSISNSDNFGGDRDRLRFTGNDRLPGAVLLARERLLQRLRSISISGNRRRERPSSGVNRNRPRFGDDFSLVDAGDWETEISREWPGGTLFTDSGSQTEQLLVAQQSSKRPPGLSQDALDHLQVEVFGISKHCAEAETSRAFWECSICLECFLEGDELTRLPCGHRFHSSCLYPWIRTCGDCPYCRAGIAASSD